MLKLENIIDRCGYLAEILSAPCMYLKDTACRLQNLRNMYHGKTKSEIERHLQNVNPVQIDILLQRHLDCDADGKEGKTHMFPLGNPVLQPIGKDGLSVRLVVPWRANYAGREIIIPSGLESDYASVPRLFWRLIPPHQYPAASLLHDYLYMSEYASRAWCDRAFYAALRDRGATLAYARVCYWAVRLCGWWVWMRHDKQAVEDLRNISL